MAVPGLEIVPQLFVDLVVTVVELALHLAILAARPWRYLLSPRFRTPFDAAHAGRHPAFKALALVWGSVLVLAIIAVAFGALRVLPAGRHGPPSPSLRERMIGDVERSAVRRIGHAASAPN